MLLALLSLAWADPLVELPANPLAYADEARAEVQDAGRTTQLLLKDAKERKDTEEIECLERKLPGLLTLADLAETTRQSLAGHLAAGEAAHADREVRAMVVILQRARAGLEAARACHVGNGTGPVEIDPMVSEPTEPVELPPHIDDPIPCGSPC